MRLLLSETQIQGAVRRIGAEVARDLGDRRPIVIPILSGAFMFAADLLRELPFDLEMQFLKASTYKDATRPSGPVEIQLRPEIPLTDRTVLVVEDIIDTGATLFSVVPQLQAAGAATVKVAVLLDKRTEELRKKSRVDYVGFAQTCDFVVGYGTDLAGLYRNLRAFYVLDEPDLDALSSR